MENYPRSLGKHVKTDSFNFNDPRFSLRNHLAYYHNDEFPLLMHSHDFYELNIIVKGKGRHYIENKNFPIDTGAVIVIPPRISHGYWAENNEMSIFHMLIDQKLLQKYSLILNEFWGYSMLFETEPELRQNIASSAFFLQLNPKYMKELSHQMDKLVNLAETPSKHPIIFETYAIGLIYDLSAIIETEYNSVGRTANKTNLFNIVYSINYMKQHLSDPIKIEELAKVTMESRTCYIEKFKLLFKMTPFEYLRKLRINHAIDLLTTTDQSIATIAQKCGFSDSAHLIKLFKNETGYTPSKYRKEKAHNEN